MLIMQEQILKNKAKNTKFEMPLLLYASFKNRLLYYESKNSALFSKVDIDHIKKQKQEQTRI